MPLYKTENPQLGDIYLAKIPGPVGAFVRFGQWAVGSASYFTHAGIVGPNGTSAIYAQPGGASLTTMSRALDNRGRVVYSNFDLTPDQRQAIWDAAGRRLGTPYSFADYAAIPALRWFHTDALETFVGASGHMICSQYVVQCYADAGVALFPKRVPGDVAPGDLANLIGAR